MRLVRALILLLIASPAIAQGSHRSGMWDLTGNAADSYDLVQADGTPMSHNGATLTLRSIAAVPANGFGAVMGGVDARSFRTRRVHLTADIDAKNVTGGGASPWLRIDGDTPQQMIAIDNAQDRAVRGTANGRIEITLFIPASAQRLAFGLILDGTGEATAHNFRIETVSESGGTPKVVRSVLDSAIALARTYSLWRDTVSWSKLIPQVKMLAEGAHSTDDLQLAIRRLLGGLGDHHSFIMPAAAARQASAGTLPSVASRVAALNGIGYVSMPAYGNLDSAGSYAFASRVQDSIAAVMPRVTCGWVVDLRTNSGGNMWPMLGALRPFLGEGGLGSFVSGSQPVQQWHARDRVDVKPAPALAPLESAYVAVLTGPRTASSGEAVTISFRERPRTRSFGLPTAGLPTANGTFSLPDGSLLLLTTAIEADRAGHRYSTSIAPDEEVTLAAHPSTDAAIERAAAWLKSQPSCR